MGVLTDCGELTGDAARVALTKTEDTTGDKYEDFPEDEDPELDGAKVLVIASQLKEFGNKAFKSADLELGLEKYQKGLRYLAEWPVPNDTDPAGQWEALQALRFTLHSNSALLQNKQKMYRDAEESATKALLIEGIPEKDQAKARYRRATARIVLKDDEGALADLKAADKAAPGDGAIVRDLAATSERLAAKKEKEKEKIKKFFK